MLTHTHILFPLCEFILYLCHNSDNYDQVISNWKHLNQHPLNDFVLYQKHKEQISFFDNNNMDVFTRRPMFDELIRMLHSDTQVNTIFQFYIYNILETDPYHK